MISWGLYFRTKKSILYATVINLSPEFCRRCKDARIARGLNQTSLAKAVGCRQSAISMFEGGMTTKISDDTVKKISDYLGIPLEPPKSENGDVVEAVAASAFNAQILHGFCPDCHCPSNVPYVVAGTLFFRPNRKSASPHGGDRCAHCGEFLEKRCPNCGAPLNDGACCEICGTPYVTSVIPEDTDIVVYAAARRRELLELKTLFQ